MSGDELNEGASLDEARAWLNERVREGVRCPCCTQFAKIYRRSITSTSVRGLVALYRAGGTVEFCHWPTVMQRKQADETKLVYWGLVEEAREVRPDGGRAGWWRVTPLGEAWLRGRVTVPKYARIFDSQCLGLEGVAVSAKQALGKRFDLAELMAS